MSPKNQDKGRLYRVKHRDGVHIASSNNNPNLKRATLLDDETNKPVGFAEFEPVDENEFEYSYSSQEYQQESDSLSGMELVAFVAVSVITKASIYAMEEYVAPKVKQWLQTTAIPTLKESWNSRKKRPNIKLLSKEVKKTNSYTIEIIDNFEIVQELFSQKLEEKYEKYVNEMTSEEAQRELADIFILSALIIKKINKLSNARIINNESTFSEYLDGKDIVGKLLTPEYIISINQILENNPQFLEEKKEDLSELLGSNFVIDGKFVPIETEKFKEMLGPVS
jgi:hypothetical protein